MKTVPTAVFPKSIMITPDGAQVWVNVYQGGQIAIYDTMTMNQVGAILAGATANTGMAFDVSGTKAFVATSLNIVAVFDTATLKPITQIPVAAQPTGIALTLRGLECSSRAPVRRQSRSLIRLRTPWWERCTWTRPARKSRWRHRQTFTAAATRRSRSEGRF